MKKYFVLLFLFFPFLCFSHDSDEHDYIFKMVLFGSDITLQPAEQEKLKMLNNASHIAIDQYNGRYENELNFLKKKRIKTIESIADIDFTFNSHHQRFTHRGWTFSYASSKGNWPKRKQLILDTTDKVFKFNSNEQHDAFSALLYYIHIIGDHDGDNKVNSIDRIPLGAEPDKLDILDELANIYLPRLFKNQIAVNELCDKLQKTNRKCAILLRRHGEGYEDRNVKRDVIDLTEEEYKIYQQYAKDTIKVLEEYIPVLLKNEKWFCKSFPSIIQK